MRYLIWFLLLFAGFNLQAQNNTVYGAGISYTNGAPTWFPNPRTSRAAVDTVTGRWYHFNTPGGWQWIGNTVEEISGCAAPAYTPSKGDSRLVVNNCTKPQVYWYDGTVWKWINEGEVYTAGQGIRIESNSIILDSLYILRFRTGSNADGAAGTMSWNATEETVDLVTDQGAVTGHLMESAYYNARNTTGTPITIGRAVMAAGTTGNTGRILIAPAIADGTVNSEYILGIAAQTIGNNSNGKVQHFGKIRGIQTNGSNFGETWVDGDVLYCSAATPGYLTKVQPTAPNLKVPIAIVIHAHPSNGTLFVRPSHFPDLAQINDVQLSSPTNGQVLTYNSTLSRWENAAPANQLQTLSTDGSAGNISISSGNTITLNVNDADASATNELQTLSVATNTATLSNSGGSVTIAGAGINTVGTAGTTITVTGTEVDGSTTNELQTLSTGTNTLTLSNGGGTVTVDTDPASDVTGSGTNGQVSFWTGPQTQSGDNNFFWDNSLKDLGIGTNTPNTRLDVIGDVEFQNPTTAFDGGVLGSELLTTGSGTNWSGTGFSTGYTHTVGSTAALIASASIANGQAYQIVFTVSNRTTGNVVFSIGGYIFSNFNPPISANTTVTVGPTTTSTAAFTITPSSDFNGTIVASVRPISSSSQVLRINNSAGASAYEFRAQRQENLYLGVGSGSLSTTGLNNLFLGYLSGSKTTTSSHNIFLGSLAGRDNTIGESNLFIGSAAGLVNISGSNNFFLGRNSGLNNTVGASNLFIGTFSGTSNIRGGLNTYLGSNAGQSNISGSNNVCIGNNAGRYYSVSNLADTSLNNSIMIGVLTRSNLLNQTNQIVIGHQSTGLGSNTTVLGNSSTTQTWLGGSLTLGTQVAPAARLHVVGSGSSSSTWTAQFHNSAGNNNALMIRDDGNVGIGTNAPTFRFDVSSSIQNSFRVVNSGPMDVLFQVPANNQIAYAFAHGSVFQMVWALTTLGNAEVRLNSKDFTIRQNSGPNSGVINLHCETTGEVGIGTTTPNASAALDVTSTTQGVLFPRMTTAQRDLIATPADGLVIYNTTDNKLQVRAGGAWVNLH